MKKLMSSFLVIIFASIIITSCQSDKSKDNATEESTTSKEYVPMGNIGEPKQSEIDLPKVIDFSAVWCGPCQMLKPIFEELESEYAGRVDFETVDVDEDPEKATEYGIEAMPTLVFLDKDGKEVNRIVGLVDKSELQGAIESILQ